MARPRLKMGVLAAVVVAAAATWWGAGALTGPDSPAGGAQPDAPSAAATPAPGAPPAPQSPSSATDPPTPDPSAPIPVLLVPGWFDSERQLAALSIRLQSAGWPSTRVEGVTFRDPTGSSRVHAEEIDSVARLLMRRTGADSIDIIAHSMGGLATRWYLLRKLDAVAVRRIVFLATPQRGTYAAHLAWGEGRDEMMPESPFLDTLNAGPPLPPGVEAITISTPIDTHVIPPESATLPGAEHYSVCCPTHEGLIDDLEAFRIALRFLEMGRGAAEP